MYSLLILHCIISLLMDIRNGKGIYLMTTFYAGVAITSFADLVYVMRIADHGVSEYSMYRYIVESCIHDATFMWVLGNTSIFIGYELMSKRSLPTIRVDVNRPAILRNIFISILVISMLTLTGNIIDLGAISGGIQKVMSLLNVMGILFFARTWVHENNTTYRNYAIILTILQTIIALYASFLRIELLTPALSFYGGYFIGKAKLKYVLSYRILPVVAMVVLFSTFFGSLAGNRSHFITAFTESKESLPSSYVEVSTGMDEGDGGTLERSSNIAQLTNVVSLVEKNGLYGGSVSFPLVSAFIPRFLWPDKPTFQLGAWFALEIGVASVGASGRANNSVNMSVPGELFLDFGWIGVIVGCILFGGMLALFWNAAEFEGTPYNLPGTLWGGYLLLYALIGMGSDLQIVVSLISTYLVFLIIRKVLVQNEDTRNRPALERQ